MKSDFAWLDKWSDDLNGKNVLELGCGPADDTRKIAELSSSVVACDLSPPSQIEGAKQVLVVDHSEELPFKPCTFDVVIASLCLHYFSWNTTQKIVSELSRVLTPKGVIVVRVNSNNDENYGAKGHTEIESGLYMVKGQQKRFFSKADVELLFKSEWKLTTIEEKSIDRYERPKQILEFSAQKI